MARRAATMPHSHGKIGSFVAADSIRSAPAINCRGLAHSVAAPLRKKARSARLLGCKRPRDGSRSLPPFFGWMPARGWIARRALCGQRAGPDGRAAERGRVGAPTDEMMQLFFDWRMWQSHFALTVKTSNKKFKKNYGLCTCKTTDIRI